MTDKEIFDGNRLIDVFMGNVWDENHVDYSKYSPVLKGFIRDKIHNPQPYNSSWDLLMPVINKIECLPIYAEISIGKGVVMATVEGNIIFHGNIIFDKNKLDTTFQAVVAFMNWLK